VANVQKYFETFHRNIRADYDMNSTLREKRDRILDLLTRRLKEAGHPSCDEMLQGSYRMGTGVLPIADLEFDIDVGLRFCIDHALHNPSNVRKWVFDAVDGHTDSVEEKGPCIRVGYSKGFHVDLVVYATSENASGKTEYRLAHQQNGWLLADPPKLLEHVRSARSTFTGTEDNSTRTDQLRRTVRYLKRWGDVAIPTESVDKPTGIGYTLYACRYLQKSLSWTGDPDDTSALLQLCRVAANTSGRVSVNKPTPEYDDVFAKLSEEAMKKLKERFSGLVNALETAAAEADPVKACEILRGVFGPDFPVPAPEDTAKKSSSPAIITSASSA
jgi:hypothetical protein